jgi:hypothetical protein
MKAQLNRLLNDLGKREDTFHSAWEGTCHPYLHFGLTTNTINQLQIYKVRETIRNLPMLRKH